MENRFRIKDLFLFLFLGAVIVLLLLSMKQYDRQWEILHAIRTQGNDQIRELAQIRRLLAQGQFMTGTASTQPAAEGADPFERVKAAQKRDDYSTGDWFIDSIPNIEKITPLVSTDVYGAEIQGRVLESLATRHPISLKWMPLLAESWETSADGMTFTFRLRKGLTFSDGQSLDADDVVFTYNWIMNPKVEAPRERAYYQKIASVKKINDHEVGFQFKEPYFESFGLAGAMQILPEHFYGKYSPEDFNQSTGLLLGSGPYRMENATDWGPGKPLRLVRNERYWGEPAPFDQLIYREIDNDLARLTTFRNGDIDLFGAQPEQYNQMLKEPDLLQRTQHYDYESPTVGYRYIAWNQKRAGKPTRFADKRVRQAMTLLTDRQRLADEIMLGYATPATGPFYRLSKQSNPDVKPWPFDVDRAKALLAEAGYLDRNGDGILEGSDGTIFQFKLTYPSGNATYEQMALFLKDTYARAGIILEPDPLDWSVFSERLKNRDFDAITLGWSAGIETDIYQMFHSDQIADQGDNFMSYNNPELDKLISQARSTVEEAPRMPLWREAHRIIHEDQPYTFLFTRKSLTFLDDRIKNVQQVPLGLNDLIEWYVPAGARRWQK